MFAAVAALIGVILGAAASGSVQFVLDKLRTRTALRAAARLLSDELVSAHSLVGTWAEQPKSYEQASADNHACLFECWDQHRNLLAAAVSMPEWRVLAAAVRQFEASLASPEAFGVPATAYLPAVELVVRL
jgi:hypothetical protein